MRLISVLAGVFSAAALLGAQAAEAGEVRVTIENVEPRAGQLFASLQTEAQFMRAEGAYSAMAQPPAQKGSVTFVFPNVAPGDYALAVMHDEDGNYQMRSAPNGMPLEGWAMSNGGRLSGPPTFALMKFTVGAAPVSLTEQIYYPYVPPAQ